ncbi:MAG: type II CAAX endopeptidase family protein [bacterium]
MKKFLAFWWGRISAFLLLFYIINQALGLIADQIGIVNAVYYEPVLVISMMLASLMIESWRAESRASLFGIQLDNQFFKNIFLGLFLVLTSYIVIIAARKLTGSVFTVNPEFTKDLLFKTIAICLLVAIYEEIFARGIIFQALIEKFGVYTSSIFVSVIFATLHLFNPSISVISFLVTFFASLILCAMYIQTKSLWLPISFHFFWNLLQILFLDSNVSGIYFVKYLLISKQENLLEKWGFGGVYGIEGGLIVLILEILIFIFVLKVPKTKPEINALLFKRSIAESKLREKKAK